MTLGRLFLMGKAMSQKNQELPHDLLAEKSLIGSLLIDGQSYDDIVDLNLKKKTSIIRNMEIFIIVLRTSQIVIDQLIT